MGKESVKVWNPLVRIFHWSLVASFITAYLSAEELEGVHALAGYAISALLLFRFFWGFMGTRHARFKDFVYGPREIIEYLKSLFGKPKHYLGHNPAGGLMVIILLLSLSLTVLSGLKAYGTEGKGPLANGVSLVSTAWADDDGDGDEGGEAGKGEEFWEEVHEFMANFTLALIAVHIGGVVVSSYLHRENLIMAMVTGRKPVDR